MEVMNDIRQVLTVGNPAIRSVEFSAPKAESDEELAKVMDEIASFLRATHKATEVTRDENGLFQSYNALLR